MARLRRDPAVLLTKQRVRVLVGVFMCAFLAVLMYGGGLIDLRLLRHPLPAIDRCNRDSPSPTAQPSASHVATKSFLEDASTAGYFWVPKSNDTTSTGGGHNTNHAGILSPQAEYRVPSRLQAKYDPSLADALLKIARGGRDGALLQRVRAALQHKSLMLVGDSSDAFLWSYLCQCDRKHNADPLATGKIKRHSNAVVSCHTDAPRRSQCNGKQTFYSCNYTALDFQVHYHGAEYAIHPYGNFNYFRGQRPECEGAMDLAACYEKKQRAACNARYGFACMMSGECRQPDLVLMNSNLWFWFRMMWAKFDERPWQFGVGWSELMESYRENATVWVRELQRTLPDVHTWGYHTTVVTSDRDGTTPGKAITRVKGYRIAQVNSAIRTLAADPELRLTLMDWAAIAHGGWDLQSRFADDIHPREVLNRAFANLLLNALALS